MISVSWQSSSRFSSGSAFGEPGRVQIWRNQCHCLSHGDHHQNDSDYDDDSFDDIFIGDIFNDILFVTKYTTG